MSKSIDRVRVSSQPKSSVTVRMMFAQTKASASQEYKGPREEPRAQPSKKKSPPFPNIKTGIIKSLIARLFELVWEREKVNNARISHMVAIDSISILVQNMEPGKVDGGSRVNGSVKFTHLPVSGWRPKISPQIQDINIHRQVLYSLEVYFEENNLTTEFIERCRMSE